MKPLLHLSAALCLLSIGWLAYRASLTADAVTRAAVEAPQAVMSVVSPALGIVDARTAYVADLLAVNLARLDVLAGKVEVDANRQTSDALAIVKDAAALTIAEVQGIRADLKPAIDSIPPAVASVKALTDDGLASWNDLYWDVKAATESTTVTLTSVAMASESIRTAAPALSESVVGISRSADGIAADVHVATSDFTRPKTTWQRVRSTLLDFGRIAARVL